jgi:hypothetical protein
MNRALLSMSWIAALSIGCSTLITQHIDLAPLGPPYKLTIYENGHPVAERELPVASKEADLIARWLESNKAGWTTTPATYAPHRLVRGDSFSLNFSDGQCVLNYAGRQLYKHSDTSELRSVFEE